MREGFKRAIVRDNHDPEKLGRIRVEYPWFQGDSCEQLSEWVEVCMPYASPEAGVWFLPEVGDEVLVYSRQNDLDHPIVFGSLFNKKHPPPSISRKGDRNEPGGNHLKSIVTRSGHVLCFDDSDDQRAILLKDKEGRRLEIESQEGKITLSDNQGNEILISGPSVTIKNKNGDSVVLEAGEVRVKSQQVKIEAAAQVELGTGAAEALVKGQSFMSLFNTHTHITGGPGSPTSPPMVPMTPAQLSQKVKTA